ALEHPDGTSTIALLGPDGDRVWEKELPVAVKHQPARSGRDVVVLTVTGKVMTLAAADGSVRWEAQVGDPWRRWSRGGAATGSGIVVAGAAGCLGAFGAATGVPRWVRDDL